MNIKTLTGCLVVASMMLFINSTLLTTPVLAAPQQGCDACSEDSSCRCGRCSSCSSRTGCQKCRRGKCPKCKEYCYLEVSEGKEERTCFEVDYKTICVPKIVPPWKKKRDPCQPVCTEAKSVKVLTSRTCECPVCEYEWKVCEPVLPQVPEGGPLLDPNATTYPATNSIQSVQSGPGYYKSITDQPGNTLAVPPRTGTSSGSQFLIHDQSPIPPAPPATGAIGDYFGGSRGGRQ